MAKSKMTFTIKDEDFDKEIQEYLQTRLRDYAKDQIKPVVEDVVSQKMYKEVEKRVNEYINRHNWSSDKTLLEEALSKVSYNKVNEAFDRTWECYPSEKIEQIITEKIETVFKSMDIDKVIHNAIQNAITTLVEKNLQNILSSATPDKE